MAAALGFGAWDAYFGNDGTYALLPPVVGVLAAFRKLCCGARLTPERLVYRSGLLRRSWPADRVRNVSVRPGLVYRGSLWNPDLFGWPVSMIHVVTTDGHVHQLKGLYSFERSRPKLDHAAREMNSALDAWRASRPAGPSVRR